MRLRQVIGLSCESMEEDSASKSFQIVHCECLGLLALGRSVLELEVWTVQKLGSCGRAFRTRQMSILVAASRYPFTYTDLTSFSFLLLPPIAETVD